MPHETTAWTPLLQFSEYEVLRKYIRSKHSQGVVSDDELNLIRREFSKTAVAAGQDWETDDPALLAVLSHAAFRMRKKLLELHPELAGELQNLGPRGNER